MELNMTLIERIVELDGQIIERPYSAEQLKEVAENQKIAADEEKKKAEIVAAKLNLLNKLGITEEEAKLLLA
jgi:hypothetical protein